MNCAARTIQSNQFAITAVQDLTAIGDSNGNHLSDDDASISDKENAIPVLGKRKTAEAGGEHSFIRRQQRKVPKKKDNDYVYYK